MNYLILIILIVFVLLIIMKFLYYLLTIQQKKITIKKKYILNINKKIVYKIFDDKKIEYLIDDDLISGIKYKKLWNQIKEGQTYYIKFYGFNIPSFAILYRIIDIL